jgi:hypothetical protein
MAKLKMKGVDEKELILFSCRRLKLTNLNPTKLHAMATSVYFGRLSCESFASPMEL